MHKRKIIELTGTTFLLNSGHGLDDDIGTAATLKAKEATYFCSKMDFTSLMGGHSSLGAGNL